MGDVDCTAGGKDLCNEVGVRGYPTIKYGDPNNLEDYKGGRDFNALKKFADEKLGPSCGPANLDLRDADKKALIVKFQAMSSGELDAAFKAYVEGLQKQYDEASKTKNDGVEAIKASGLGLMKAVQAHAKLASKGEEL